MSPVAQSNRHAGRALAVAIAGVGLAVAMMFGVAVLANRGSVDVRLGDDEFDAGQVESIVDPIDEEGPARFADVALGRRPIYVSHSGDDVNSGWVAYSAFDPADPDCLIDFERATKVLFNLCDPDVTYPLDGSGLRQYPTRVEDGHLYVDLNGDPDTTTSTPSG